MAFSGMVQNATRTQFGRCNHARNIYSTYSTLETLEEICNYHKICFIPPEKEVNNTKVY